MKKIKNWGFYALFIIGAVVDLGFNEIEPLLAQIGVGEKGMGFIRLALIIAGAAKLKSELPTQNVEKLKEIVKAEA